MKSKISNSQIIVYQNKVKVMLDKETVWLTQKQISELFGTKRPAITKHLSNIFKSKELDKKSVCSKMEHTDLSFPDPWRLGKVGYLVALTLMIAASEYSEKDAVIKVILNLLK